VTRSHRSLGLTILAVAKGRFPLNTKEGGKGNRAEDESSSAGGEGEASLTDSSAGSPQRIVGGAAGYWAMIKAICDDEPPRAGPSFSAEFNAFIRSCLQKDPAARLSSKQLLSEPFIANNANTLKMSTSDLQEQRRKLSMLAEISAEESGRSGEVPTGPRGCGLGINLRVDTVTPVPDALPGSILPSPLTTRLTSAAISRRASKDYPGNLNVNTDSPSLSLRKGTPGGPDGSGKASIPEHGIAEDVEASDNDPQAANNVIVAIRLEHLDRVLERIVGRIRNSLRSGRRYSSASGNDEDDGGWEEGEGGEAGEGDGEEVYGEGVLDDALLQPHDSVDSMDQLLYKGTESEETTTVLQAPPARLHGHAPPAAGSGAGADLRADAKEAVRGEEVSPYKGSVPPLLHKAVEKEVDDFKHSDDKDEKHAQGGIHSILKVSAIEPRGRTCLTLLLSLRVDICGSSRGARCASRSGPRCAHNACRREESHIRLSTRSVDE
jgi:hypothetical protein